MKMIILILLLAIWGITTIILKAKKSYNSYYQASFNMLPAFSIAQSRQCSRDMEAEKTQNHRYDESMSYNDQLLIGLKSLNEHKCRKQTSISQQYEEGFNG